MLASVEGEAHFVVQACNGLALAIEQSTLPGSAEEAKEAEGRIAALLAQYTSAMGAFGPGPGQMDTLVLGCTHYVFVEKPLRALLGPDVQLVSTGEPVARHTQRLLAAAGLLNPGKTNGAAQPMRLLTTGDLQGLQAAAQRWLGLPPEVCEAVPAALQGA